MDFTASQYAQLIVAVICGISIFVMVHRLSEKTTLTILILMVPFQLIDSRYGSLNMLLIYLVAGAYLLQGRLKRLPFIGPMLFINFAFLIAFSQSHPAARMHHVLFLIGFFSNVLLFYMVYNYLLRTGDWKHLLNTLVALNVLVIIYCAIQFVAGSQSVQIPGVQELQMYSVRDDGRLRGPFKATAAAAEYFTLQCLLLAYLLIGMPAQRLRKIVLGLLALNTLFLIATGNRGGFVTLVLGAMVFLIAFRRELGLLRATKMLVSATIVYVVIALLLVNFTDYGMLFGRLEGTTVEGGVPDTREEAWANAWERIKERPWLGHGPELSISSRDQPVADIPFMLYPHNLALSLLYTCGIVGLAAWIVFFWALCARLASVRNVDVADLQLKGLPKLGLVSIFILLISQIRIEFLRSGLIDYQNYLFVLFSLFLASRDLIVSAVSQSKPITSFGKNGLEKHPEATVPASGQPNL
jgi:O-antigen ligase